jgi:hypothetical protein
MKGILLSVSLVAIMNIASAQNAYEALRYSQTFPSGTARGQAVGGAFGALGADLTSAGINPGGLGVYRNSEASFSVNLNATNSLSNFGGNNTDQMKLNFNAPNFGVVLNKMYEDKRGNRGRGKWVAINFAFSMTQHANFNTKRFYENNIDAQSLLPGLASELNGLRPGDVDYSSASFESVLAYAGYLINPTEDDTLTYNTVVDGSQIGKQVAINSSGRNNELAFSLATNYDNKIYFGATLGVPLISYSENALYAEYDVNNTIAEFNDYEIERRIRTSGGGVNLKLGAVYRINDWLRLGTALHTPSYIRLKDTYSSNIFSNFDTISYQAESPDGSFKYRMLTPWRGVVSAAFLVKQYGFISVDYEYADYRNSRFSFGNEFQAFETSLNRTIDNTLNISHTIRAGAETAIKNFRLRGGYNISTNPFSTPYQIFNDRVFQSVSGGMGYRGKQFSLDFAYVRSVNDNPILLANTVVSSDRITRDNFILTFGLRF